MKIFTVQKKSVAIELRQKGIYVPDHTHSVYYQGEAKKAYDLIIHKINGYPIWCLATYEGKKLSYRMIKNTSNLIYLMPLCQENSVIMEIEKPDNEILLTDYYNWVDTLYYYQDAYGKEKADMKSWGCDTLANALTLRKDCSIQAIIKDIKSKEVVKMYQCGKEGGFEQ